MPVERRTRDQKIRSQERQRATAPNDATMPAEATYGDQGTWSDIRHIGQVTALCLTLLAVATLLYSEIGPIAALRDAIPVVSTYF